MRDSFRRFASAVASWAGSPLAFALAVGFVAGWVCAGPHYRWSDGHALLLNDVTTSVTFALVFLIQHTANRESRERKIQNAEIITAIGKARNELAVLDDLPDVTLEQIQREFEQNDSSHQQHG